MESQKIKKDRLFFGFFMQKHERKTKIGIQSNKNKISSLFFNPEQSHSERTMKFAKTRKNMQNCM